MNALTQLTMPFQVLTSDPALREALQKTRSNEALLIFMFMDVKDIEILNEIRSQILDRKIITILPDDSAHSRSIGCSVLPRFQALLSDDMSVVAAVAANIIDKDSGKFRLREEKMHLVNEPGRKEP
jgi:hypothetical protein